MYPFNPMMQHGFHPMGMPRNEGGPFQRRPMMGGNLPPQGYDSSGINPGGMYTGGPMQPHPMGQ